MNQILRCTCDLLSERARWPIKTGISKYPVIFTEQTRLITNIKKQTVMKTLGRRDLGTIMHIYIITKLRTKKLIMLKTLFFLLLEFFELKQSNTYNFSTNVFPNYFLLVIHYQHCTTSVVATSGTRFVPKQAALHYIL